MKSERLMRHLTCRWFSVAVLALLGSLVWASAAQAEVQTFFVVVPDTLQGEEREAYQECAERLNAALVNTMMFRANADAETQRTVSSCIGETASANAQRECDLSIANVEVDWLMILSSRQIGGEWKWGVAARSPAAGGDQKWGGNEIPAGVTDRTRAAYEACDALGKQFACQQGVGQACLESGLGHGPVLASVSVAPTDPSPAQPARARMSALDVMEPTPQVVSVWIDGKEAGSSENQITGIPPGRHEVALKATGYFADVAQLSFEAGVPTALTGVRLRKTTATLIVTMGEPEFATVFIGGRERGTTANPIAGIAPGEVDVLLRSQGYRERRQRMTLEADKVSLLESIQLEPLPATLTVTVNILGAEVIIDGKVVGLTTGAADAFEVEPTAKLLEVRRSGLTTFVKPLSLRGGESSAVTAELVKVRAAQGGTRRCPAGYVRIRPGSYENDHGTPEQGVSSEQQPDHRVTITRAFCMKATEVTQGEWQAVMGNNPSLSQNCGQNCPVEQVSWNDAVLYANALSRRDGLQECYQGSTFSGLDCTGYRLPSEAEWVYSALGGATQWTVDDNQKVDWAFEESSWVPEPVKSGKPNAWGIYCMIGNVWEWTGDWHGYPGGIEVDPLGPAVGSMRMTRGGLWRYLGMSQGEYRDEHQPNERHATIGFRLVRSLH